jgi:hypothetical protein
MSWSVGTKGPVTQVKDVIAKQFETSGPCIEPEETIRQKARELIALALEHQGYSPNVEVSAYGSQSTDYETKAISNSLSIIITPQG